MKITSDTYLRFCRLVSVRAIHQTIRREKSETTEKKKREMSVSKIGRGRVE